MMKRIFISAAVSAVTALGCVAATTSFDTIQELMNAGDYETAIMQLNDIAAREPRSVTAAMLLGDCFRSLNNDAEAIAQYQKAVSRGSNDARLGLIEIAIREYRLDDADKLIADYRKGLKKGKKGQPDESEAFSSRLERTRNMLNRVERIVVFDSINVPAEDFFTHYRLSPESGSLNAVSVLPRGYSAASPTVVYEPESRIEMLWAAPDSEENHRLVRSVALYGDEWDAPESIGDHLREGGDANYPFMMSDGITLYYANDGENSLGGYDIFITRRDGNEFLQPQNIGMPYNSPYNDYMLAIDETTGVGWWASDRNRIDGMVTIYMFRPADMRVNVDVNSPDLISRARLTSIASTMDPGADYSELKHAVASVSKHSYRFRTQCQLTLPDGRVISRLEELTESDARLAMRRYLDLEKSVKADRDRLDMLRDRYAGGDKSVAAEIMKLEKQSLDDVVTLRHAANEVIMAECGDR